MNDFVARGGPWVLGQAILLASVATLAVIRPLPFSFDGHQAVGSVLVVGGVALALVAASALGSNLSPFPVPLLTGHMVARGPYRVVRHPIYTGVIGGGVGIAVALGDWLSLLAAISLLPFFYAKTTREEAHLLASYDDYGDYRRRVTKRLVPGVL